MPKRNTNSSEHNNKYIDLIKIIKGKICVVYLD